MAEIDQAKQVAAQCLLFELEIAEVTRILEGAGIDSLVLKGPHLSNTVYEKEGDRLYGDLDILVHPGQHADAVSLLEGHGYHRIDPKQGRSVTARSAYNVPLRTPRDTLLELHRFFSPLDRYPLDAGKLFAESTEFTIGQVKARGLKPEHLLTHLIIHVLKSFFVVEQKHYRDIALVCNKLSLDWSEIESLIRSAGAVTGAYYALEAARLQHGARIPPDVMHRLRPGLARRAWIERFIHPARYPVNDATLDHMGPTRLRLGLVLIDDKRKWLSYLVRYAWIRLQDFLQDKTGYIAK